MDIRELRRLTLPKLRDLAKAETELQGVGGMRKEDLLKAVAKAKGIAYDESHKDASAIRSIKHDIRELKKEKSGLLTSSRDPKKLKMVQRKIRRLKRLTRHLAHEAKTAQAAQAVAPAQPATRALLPMAAGTDVPPVAQLASLAAETPTSCAFATRASPATATAQGSAVTNRPADRDSARPMVSGVSSLISTPSSG